VLDYTGSLPVSFPVQIIYHIISYCIVCRSVPEGEVFKTDKAGQPTNSFESLKSETKTKKVAVFRAIPNILFVFYSVRIVGRIVYSYSAE